MVIEGRRLAGMREKVRITIGRSEVQDSVPGLERSRQWEGVSGM